MTAFSAQIQSLGTILAIGLWISIPVCAQQPYQGSDASAFACHSSKNEGYLCSDMRPSCQSYTVFLVREEKLAMADVSDLFHVSASDIAEASGISPTQQLVQGQFLLIPLNCTCVDGHSEAMSSYTFVQSDTLYVVATRRYENVTTCRAIRDANPSLSSSYVAPGVEILIPVRCACPSKAQEKQGFKILVTYPVQSTDTMEIVSQRFGVNVSTIAVANEIPIGNSTLFPGSTILLPFTQLPALPPPLISPPPVLHGSLGRIWNVKLFVIVGVFLCASICLILSSLGYYKWKKRAIGDYSRYQQRMKDESSIQIPEMLSYIKEGKPADLSLDEIKEATKDFNDSSRIEGGSVFKGILETGITVAIKRIDGDVSEELQIQSKVHHRNLLRLIGVCKGHPSSYLVYEYADNSSLSFWLRREHSTETWNSHPLTWYVRLGIALDVATGLQYMHEHSGMGLVHGNINSDNILLDANFRGKIADVGKASSHGSRKESIIKAMTATRQYMAPESVLTNRYTCKSDVFSFGVILLELLSGMDATQGDSFWWRWIGTVMDGENPEQSLLPWIDPRLDDVCTNLETVLEVAMLARRCLYEDPDLRPNTSTIACSLSKLVRASELIAFTDGYDGLRSG
eukprot:c29122_g1_i1 orf=163-2043(+)